MARDLTFLLEQMESAPHIGIEYCVGAGKTSISSALASLLFKEGRISHVVIAAPTRDIRDQWGDLRGLFGFQGGEYLFLPTVRPVPNKFTLRNYLTQPNPHGRVFLTTHSGVGKYAKIDGLDLRSCLFISDEAHHQSEEEGEVTVKRNLLSSFGARWEEQGGSRLSLSGSPHRTSAKEVAIPASIPKASRALVRQMAEGFAPEVLENEIIKIKGEVEEGGYADLFQPADVKCIAEGIFESFVEDGRPKSIVRLKGLGPELGHKTGDKHRAIILALAEKFEAEGARVFIASTTHLKDDPNVSEDMTPSRREEIAKLRAINARTMTGIRVEKGMTELSALLKEDNSVSYLDSLVDVVIGMNTVVEGINWKKCSHIFYLGLPRSLNPVTQGAGRTVRQKDEYFDYPRQWANRSKMVFIVAGGANNTTLTHRHKQEMLRLSCYLAGFYLWNPLRLLKPIIDQIKVETDRVAVRDALATLLLDEDDGHMAAELDAERQKMLDFFSRNVQGLPMSFADQKECLPVWLKRYGKEELLPFLKKRILQDQVASLPQREKDDFVRKVGDSLDGESVSAAMQEIETELLQTLEKYESKTYASSVTERVAEILQTFEMTVEGMTETLELVKTKEEESNTLDRARREHARG